MTPIEICALIFAILVLVKLIVISINPRKWMDLAETLLKSHGYFSIVYLILAVIVGYYLMQELTVIQIVSAMLFTMLLAGLTMMQYPGPILKLSRETLKDKKVLSKNWFSVLIWIAIAVYTLYLLFN